MKIVKEFSRFAEEYKKHNMIQLEVALRLTSMLDKKRYTKVLDLGCGSGAMYDNFIKKRILVDEFIAFDFSQKMLDLHPSSFNIRKVCADFNKKESFLIYEKSQFDIVVSASALQWSDNLSMVLDSISSLANNYYFAFFTSNTFATLHKTAGIKSPIYSKEFIIENLDNYYGYELEEQEYRLKFSSVREMFKYIKRSGVSGGTGELSYRSMKRLMLEYPLDYLEFEVVFVKAWKL